MTYLLLVGLLMQGVVLMFVVKRMWAVERKDYARPSALEPEPDNAERSGPAAWRVSLRRAALPLAGGTLILAVATWAIAQNLEVQGNVSAGTDTSSGPYTHSFMGDVGIGTASPAAKLEVNGNFKLQNGVAVNNIDTSGTLGGASASNSAIPTQLAVKTYADAAGGGGCYVSYSGGCLSGFSNKGSLGTWGWCGSGRGFLPPGSDCPSGWYNFRNGTAYACCE